MTFKHFITALLILAGCFNAEAQLRFGFKTGLNFASIKGPSEKSAAGASLETFGNVTGFHVGMSVGYPITDAFSIRGEFMYSKRGGKYTYEGPGYRFFRNTTTDRLTVGTSKYLVNINNSYLDIPVMAVGRWHDFEVSGGAYLGLNIQSTGEGSLTYSSIEVQPNPSSGGKLGDAIEFNLNQNYRGDDPGEAAQGSENLVVRVGATNFETPKTLGAYTDLKSDLGRLYNVLDYGLVGGVSYYLSNALYASVRLQYGLADITNNSADVAKSGVGENNVLLLRDDKDRNFVIQASVGFGF